MYRMTSPKGKGRAQQRSTLHVQFHMGDPLALNGQFHRNVETLMRGWQSFVQHRVQENSELAERLQKCTQPVQIWPAYQEFWVRTAENVQQGSLRYQKDMRDAAAAIFSNRDSASCTELPCPANTMGIR
jgi:hypothetical protein